MRKEILKYIGLGLVAVVLLFANITMVYKTFFAKSRLDPSYKQPSVVTDDDIRRYADSLFVHTDSLQIIEVDIMSNKRVIITNGDTLGYCFIVYEPIPCPSCSDVNYVLITDKSYIIKNIRFLKDIVEDYKILPIDSFKIQLNTILNKNLMDIEIFNIKLKLNKYSNYFIKSLIILNSNRI